MATISIQVDAYAARAYRQASAEEQRKLQILLSLRLRELTAGTGRPLKDILDEIGAHAEEKGLTPEILGSLLNDT
jgi:hypothetical protein